MIGEADTDVKDAFLTKMDIPNNFLQPDGCDIISRKGKLRPKRCQDKNAFLGTPDLTLLIDIKRSYRVDIWAHRCHILKA